MTHETWWQRVKGRKIAQALKRLQEYHSPENGNCGLRRAFNKRQVILGWCVHCLKFVIAEIGANTRIRGLMNSRHGLTPDVRRAKSVLLALGFSEGGIISKALQAPAKTGARNNVRIVDKGNEFPHYTGDVMSPQ